MLDFTAKMSQIQFRPGSAPDNAEGAYSALPDPLAGFKALILRKGRGRAGKWKGKGRGGSEREREGREGKGGREKKRRGAYRDEGPLTNILNTPLGTQ